jgi:hypothetical protein
MSSYFAPLSKKDKGNGREQADPRGTLLLLATAPIWAQSFFEPSNEALS